MREYALTPSGWTVTTHRFVGPFATHVTWRRSDGCLVEWFSPTHRKHASRLFANVA